MMGGNLEIEKGTCLSPYFARLSERPTWRWSGQVVEANGQMVASEGPPCSVGECAEIIDVAATRHHAG